MHCGEQFWDGVYVGLFEALRILCPKLADQRGVPANALFIGTTFRDMARLRPSTPSALLGVRDVGERKLADLGQRFIEEIVTYGRENRL